MDKVEELEDQLAKPVTAIFAAIGIIYVTLKIFSFWRLFASLFILPGESVGNKCSISIVHHV